MAKQKSKGGIFATIALILVTILALGMISQGRDSGRDSVKDSTTGTSTETSSSEGLDIPKVPESFDNVEFFENESVKIPFRTKDEDTIVYGNDGAGTTIVETVEKTSFLYEATSNYDYSVFFSIVFLSMEDVDVEIEVSIYNGADFTQQLAQENYIFAGVANEWVYASCSGDNNVNGLPEEGLFTVEIVVPSGLKIASIKVYYQPC